MTRKDIRTGKTPVSCAVCGRTLLPGENADIYLAGGQRRPVCELCNTRAAAQGWIRESAQVELPSGRSAVERRSMFERLRSRREQRREDGNGAEAAPPAEPLELEPEPELPQEPAHPEPAPDPAYDPAAEPRHVHAIPASGEMKAAEALQHFNASEHPRTVAGVARSLGEPTVSVMSDAERLSVVKIVVSWELCWYRYEVDLADGDSGAGVMLTGQGYELNDLDAAEQSPNASADERGALKLAG